MVQQVKPLPWIKKYFLAPGQKNIYVNNKMTSCRNQIIIGKMCKQVPQRLYSDPHTGLLLYYKLIFLVGLKQHCLINYVTLQLIIFSVCICIFIGTLFIVI